MGLYNHSKMPRKPREKAKAKGKKCKAVKAINQRNMLKNTKSFADSASSQLRVSGKAEIPARKDN